VVAKWLGNTPAIAMKHYVDPTDADFERALSADLKQTGEANSEAADARKALQATEAANLPMQENCPQPIDLQQVSGICGFLPSSGKTPKVEAAGIEPASQDISASASTCVSDLRFSPARPRSAGSGTGQPGTGFSPGDTQR